MSGHTISKPKQVFLSLNGLRFILAIWIAYFHVGHMFDDAGMGTLPFLRLGIARVDVFFCLSGFVLSHVYWAQRTKPFNFADFMVARLARIYPMYLLALGIIIAYLAGGALLGKAPSTSYPFSDLVMNLLFLQASGLTETNSWNFPAWAVAAEMGGYIAFPIFIYLAQLTRKLPYLLLAIAIGLVLLLEIFLQFVSPLPMNELTTDWGILRGASVMFCGVAARSVFNIFKPNTLMAIITAIAGISLVFTSAMQQWGVPLVGLGAAFLMIGLARLDELKCPTGLSSQPMQELGNWSYVIFILHAPIYTILAQIWSLAGYEFVATPLTSLVFMSVVILVSGPIYHLVEKPSRKFIRKQWEMRRGHTISNAGL
ncbi:acyltransferase family protein [Hirschia litorea]|uniref:Acyltransferase family protein n=1 Tax=Hirschia litorea TaxID=1199156 RepID=A0ABW2IMA6_9PROT